MNSSRVRLANLIVTRVFCTNGIIWYSGFGSSSLSGSSPSSPDSSAPPRGGGRRRGGDREGGGGIPRPSSSISMP